MNPPNILFSGLLLIAGMACLIVAVFVWQQRRNAHGAVPLVVMMVAMSFWDLTYAAYWVGAPGPGEFFWVDLTYVGVVIIPVAFFAFALEFADFRKRLRLPVVLALLVIPLLTLALLWTDPWHGLFFAGQRLPGSAVILDGGPAFWANVIYAYGLVLAASVVLVRVYLQSSGLFRKQAGLVLGAIGVTWLNSIVLMLKINPLPNADNTPFAFSLTALIFAYALLRYELLEVAPIARDVLVENMSDGVVVLDVKNRIVDLNPVAQQVVGVLGKSAIGQPVERVFTAYAEIIANFNDVVETQTEVKIRESPPQYLDLRITPLYDRRQLFVGRLIIWRDISELKRVQVELEQFATIDLLTQIYNRRHFLLAAERELKRAQRFNRPLSLVMLDIDHFKRINDTLGHAAGDQALSTIAQLCRENVRDTDTLARYGGEEFVLLMPETDLAQAYLVVERLRGAIAAWSREYNGRRISFTASFGIAAPVDHQETLAILLAKVDQALYAAKQAGRNRVVIWEERLET